MGFYRGFLCPGTIERLSTESRIPPIIQLSKNMLIVITGPGSVGKDAVAAKLLKRHRNFLKVITTTSRTPRLWEKKDRDYRFISTREFEDLINSGNLLEYVFFSGNYYGTTKKALDPFLESRDMVWKVETTRGAQIRELFEQHFPQQAADLFAKTVVVYLNVPSWDILRDRLKKRGMSDEVIGERLDQDRKDWEMYKDKFKNIVVNVPGKLDRAVEEIERLISKKNESI